MSFLIVPRSVRVTGLGGTELHDGLVVVAKGLVEGPGIVAANCAQGSTPSRI